MADCEYYGGHYYCTMPLSFCQQECSCKKYFCKKCQRIEKTPKITHTVLRFLAIL